MQLKDYVQLLADNTVEVLIEPLQIMILFVFILFIILSHIFIKDSVKVFLSIVSIIIVCASILAFGPRQTIYEYQVTCDDEYIEQLKEDYDIVDINQKIYTIQPKDNSYIFY